MHLKHITFNLRLFAAIVMMVTSFAVMQAKIAFTLNGCPVFADEQRCLLLATVPEGWFGTTVEMEIVNGQDRQVVQIDGQDLGENRKFIFHSISGDKSWQVVYKNHEGESMAMRLEFTFLPIVSLEGDIGYEYTQGTVLLVEPGKAAGEVMMANLKWRGNTTNAYNKHKRNYSVNFIFPNGEKQNRRLLGMRRDNHWILDAGQADMARIRNRIATDLWLDMAREPYYFDQAPDVLTGARGQIVELFLGNDYRGIFNLSEAVDRKQLQLVKHDSINGIFHGGLWKTNDFTTTTGFRVNTEFCNDSADYDGFETEYPDFEEVCPTDYQVLYDAVESMVLSESVYDYNELVDDHFDIPVMIDYVIFFSTLSANDNETRNIFWLCHDRAVDPRLSIAVWDLDASVGQSWSPFDWRPPLTAYNYMKRPYNWNFKMLYHYKCKYHQDFLDRYDELRQTWLSTESLVNRYGSAIDRLINCGAAHREEQRWNGDSDLFDHPLDFAAEKQYIIEWFEKRMPLHDQWIHHHVCDVNFDGAINAADITLMYNMIFNSQTYNYLYDTNFDGYLNASDVVGVYNVIFGLD